MFYISNNYSNIIRNPNRKLLLGECTLAAHHYLPDLDNNITIYQYSEVDTFNDFQNF